MERLCRRFTHYHPYGAAAESLAGRKVTGICRILLERVSFHLCNHYPGYVGRHGCRPDSRCCFFLPFHPVPYVRFLLQQGCAPGERAPFRDRKGNGNFLPADPLHGGTELSVCPTHTLAAADRA